MQLSDSDILHIFNNHSLCDKLIVAVDAKVLLELVLKPASHQTFKFFLGHLSASFNRNDGCFSFFVYTLRWKWNPNKFKFNN